MTEKICWCETDNDDGLTIHTDACDARLLEAGYEDHTDVLDLTRFADEGNPHGD